MERDRLLKLTDLANAVRVAQNGTREQFSNYVETLTRMVG